MSERRDVNRFRNWLNNQPEIKDVKFGDLPDEQKKILVEQLYQKWKNMETKKV